MLLCYKFEIMKKGFTLTEILITLAIIGVVAALTLPTLIQKCQKHVTANRLKQSYALIAQAFEMAKADYGEDTTAWEGNANTAASAQTMYTLYFEPYLKTINAKQGALCKSYKCVSKYKNLKGLEMNFHDWDYSFYLMNGTFIHIRPYVCGMHLYAPTVYVDINGPEKGPNILGKDMFDFVLEIGYGAQYQLGGKNRPFVTPYDWYSREDLLQMCSKEYDGNCCNALGIKSACASLIKKDGWKISNDYPW